MDEPVATTADASDASTGPAPDVVGRLDLAATVLPPRRSRTMPSSFTSPTHPAAVRRNGNGGRASHLTLIDARTDERERTAPGITSISAIARKSRLSTQHIGRVLRGQEGASFDAACRIADAAGVTLDALRAYIQRQAARLVAG